MARKSFKKETIAQLENILGLSYENASKLQRRLYRQLLYRTQTKTSKRGTTKQNRPYNATRELFYSVTGKGAVKFSQDFMNVSSVEMETARDILKSRMKNLIKKTGGMKGEVGTAINDYLRGRISYKDMKKVIDGAKRTARYMAVQEETIS